jgi:hypothetical protein
MSQRADQNTPRRLSLGQRREPLTRRAQTPRTQAQHSDREEQIVDRVRV